MYAENALFSASKCNLSSIYNVAISSLTSGHALLPGISHNGVTVSENVKWYRSRRAGRWCLSPAFFCPPSLTSSGFLPAHRTDAIAGAR
jgi:hypothetical protein